MSPLDETEQRCAMCFCVCILGAEFCGEKCAREFKAWFAAAMEVERAKVVRV